MTQRTSSRSTIRAPVIDAHKKARILGLSVYQLASWPPRPRTSIDDATGVKKIEALNIIANHFQWLGLESFMCVFFLSFIQWRTRPTSYYCMYGILYCAPTDCVLIENIKHYSRY